MLTADSPELGQMQAAYADARSDTQLAERNHARESELYERGITPRKALEETGAALEKARHEQERIRLQLLNLNISAGITDNRFTLRSPLSGTVTESHANPGQQIWPDSSPALFVVSDIRHLWVILDIFEKDLALIHPGQVVTLSVLAYPGEKFQAHVEYVHQVVDETTRTIKVRCTLDNPQLKLLPAMFASAEVESDPDDKAIVVPLSAIFTEGNADWLFTVTQPGHYHRKKVSVGLRLKDSAVIEQGISPGTRMVMDGAFLLHNEAMTRQPSS
jgi:cobalt-zinc-cadmium efflux system membrane fusion protein